MRTCLILLFVAVFIFPLVARQSDPESTPLQCSAYFDVPTTSNCPGQEVPFIDLSYSTMPNDYITTWTWTFGDGVVQTINFPYNPCVMHTYTSPGIFQVTLAITTLLGCTDTEQKNITISIPPLANFLFPSTVKCAGMPVQFTDLSQTNGGGAIVAWDWNFGDNSAHSAFQNPVHAYTDPGSFNVTLIITNINSCTDTIIKIVTIDPVPVATITPDGPTVFCQGSSVTLTAGLANSYLWSTGATTQSIPVTTSGSYYVTVNGGSGCSATSSPVTVTVHPNPLANAGPDQSIVYGATTSLTGSASGGSQNYSWHWEPASMLVNPDVQNPVTVSLTFSQFFTLAATDSPNGCTGTDQVLVTVSGGPLSLEVTATPESTCAGNAVQLMAIVSGGTGNNTYQWSSDPAGFAANTYDPVAFPGVSTTYLVTVNDGITSLTDSASVSVLPQPGVPEAPTGPDTVDLNAVISTEYYTTGGMNAVSYIWELSPESAGTISGSGSNGTVAWNQNYLGTAFITVRSVNSCGESGWSQGKVTSIINSVTGTGHEKGKNVLAIYPNPTTGMVYLSLKGKSNISIFTTTGILVRSGRDFTSGWLDLSGNPKGIYLLRIESPSAPVIQKKIVLLY